MINKESIDLEEGREYSVMLYPKRIETNARFLGKKDSKNVFVASNDGETRYLFLNDSCITNIDGTLTYHPTSGAHVDHINSNELGRDDMRNRRLTEILDKLGVTI